MPVKLLSDFDGVWTDQALEAEVVKLCLTTEAAQLAGTSLDRAREDFSSFESEVRARPDCFGWAPDGRIAAYVDEDPLCISNAIASYIADQKDDALTEPYREAILASEFENLNRFADACFRRAMEGFRNEHPPTLVPQAASVIEELRAADVEIVIVSNSPVEKIASWFSEVGVDAGGGSGHAIRVRGEAGKQKIGLTDECIQVGGRPVYVDRPDYSEVVLGEDPDVVIGDVFSLDLALPLVLRDAGIREAPEILVLRKHPHTPEWVLGLSDEGSINHVIGGVEGLLEILEGVGR